MVTIFPFKFLIDLLTHSGNFAYPNYLKTLVKQNDIEDFGKLEDFFSSELQQVPLQDQQTLQYFLFLGESALICYIYRREPQKFAEINSLIQHRMTAIRNIEGTEINFAEWEQYFSFISTVSNRMGRFIPIEKFESYIDKIEWNALSQEFIPKISHLLGLTYLHENNSEQISKARLWLSKAIGDSSFPSSVINQVLMAEYFRKTADAEAKQHLERIVGLILQQGEEESGSIRSLFQSLAREVEVMAKGVGFPMVSTEGNDLSVWLEEFEEWRGSLTKDMEKEEQPSFSRAYIELLLGTLYAKIISHKEGEEIAEEHITRFNYQIQQASNLVEGLNDAYFATQHRLQVMQAKVAIGQQLPEKDFKELLTQFRRGNDYLSFMAGLKPYGTMLAKHDMGTKVLDSILEGFKLGKKKIEEGGFYLLNKSFQLANELFLQEIKKPGVSWLINSLDKFFEEIVEIIETLPTQAEQVGKQNIEDFQASFLAFEPLSHHQINVYFKYQLYTLKLMQIGAELSGDPIAKQLGNQLIKELENSNNPLHFINATWSEFKDIPNKVRNSTLNKCINITKGDLPLAAEHLDFSYRNLRSYITFKEVNRLGLFLSLQETDNKQLETGIRYMFYDLYKKGTIFEVVFDMPSFLVKYSRTGFFSQNLEEELKIKGTTAKKYIKIMMEIGLISQDKNSGRKHFYRLNKENVMKRLGREQEVRIG